MDNMGPDIYGRQGENQVNTTNDMVFGMFSSTDSAAQSAPAPAPGVSPANIKVVGVGGGGGNAVNRMIKSGLTALKIK